VVGGGDAGEEGGQVDVPQVGGAGQDVDGEDGGDQTHGALGGGGLLGRNNREVGASDDDTLERVEVVPRVDDLRHE